MNILYVNACVRENSRTKILAQYLLKKYNQSVDEINLDKECLKSLNKHSLQQRDKLISNSEFNNEMFKYAKQFANADKIIIAAPFWDLSFPSLLKTYIENINVSGITFYYTEEGRPKSLCKADELVYITTAGGSIFSDEYGFGYIKNLCNAFYGINDVKCIKAEKLDIIGADVENILNKAKQEIDKFFI